MFPVLSANGPSGYNLTKSVRLRQDANGFFSRTPGSAGNRQKWTFSTWVKFGELSNNRNLLFGYLASPAEQVFEFTFNANNVAYIWFYDAGSGTPSNEIISTPVYRDPSAWYHFVLAVDTTQATASNRVKLYVNGVQVTSFSTAQYPAQNWNSTVNAAGPQQIGKYGTGGGYWFDGYLAETIMVDGQQLTPSSFGSTNPVTGVWQPAQYTGTYGTNGYLLQYTDVATTSGSNAGLGKDFSGNGNYYNTNNISVTSGYTYDSMNDVPTLTSSTAANYSTMNPLSSGGGAGGTVMTYGNLYFSYNNGAPNYGATAFSTMSVPSGKWYFENTIQSDAAVFATYTGVINNTFTQSPSTANNWSNQMVTYDRTGRTNVFGTTTTGYATYTAGDVIGVALDIGNNQVTFYKNNTLIVTITNAGISSSYYWFAMINGGNSGSTTMNVNFGQQPFTYTPPSGFVGWNTYNLANSTIPAGNKYMDATLYTGNGTGQAITNTGGFKPDLVWIKCRSNAYDHNLFDSVRGPLKHIESNLTVAQYTESAGATLTAFNSNGFQLGTDNGNYGSTNNTNWTYVGWQWQGGAGTTNTNTNGSVTSSVSANTTAGFSVVTFTTPSSAGSYTVGHGLGVAPSLVIVKDIGTTSYWITYHASLGANKYMLLNATDTAATDNNAWNNTSPTSTVFSGTTAFYGTSRSEVAYCFAQIAGFSSFGTYTGNGSADGPFIYTGFRPKFVMIKRTDSTSNWGMWDSVRGYYNVNQNFIRANTNDEETTADSTLALDFVSNGIKVRGTWQGENASGGSFIYMAFAENPFKNALAR